MIGHYTSMRVIPSLVRNPSAIDPGEIPHSADSVRNDVIGFSERLRKGVENGNLGGNGVLTFWRRVLFSIGSLVATLLDREAEQTLFDNRYDVPESVRPHSGFRARMG